MFIVCHFEYFYVLVLFMFMFMFMFIFILIFILIFIFIFISFLFFSLLFFPSSFTPHSHVTLTPFSWESRVDSQGRTYYVDHHRRITQWDPPPYATWPTIHTQYGASNNQ